MAEEEAVVSLEETPTWAVATVCAILITNSILIKHAFHLLSKYFQRNRRRSLNQALYKIKSELMLLGFISLSLTISEGPISNICIPNSVGETFLPCQSTTMPSDAVEETVCQEKGMVSLLSRKGFQQLQFLIFVLAFFHVLSCVLTFALGMAKMRKWKHWEAETRKLEFQFYNDLTSACQLTTSIWLAWWWLPLLYSIGLSRMRDPRRFRLTHQTSFGRRHLKWWSQHPLLRWSASFLRQFNGSVSKADYFTLRHGFIMAHLSEGNNFDFQKFLNRALDDDFHVVVGLSLKVWIFSLFFLFFQAHGFYNYFWLPFIPLVMLLLVGTKLQVIITRLCLASGEAAPVVKGTFLVKPSDNFFWFSQPRLLLHLIHFIIFQNSFQLAFFIWTWYKFGFRSCFHGTTIDIVIRITLVIIIQVLSGYVILPLYALVTQMGSSLNKAVFTERVLGGLKKWHNNAKKSIATSKSNSTTPSPDISISHTHNTSIFGGQEFGSTELGSPSSVNKIKEEENIEQEMNGQGNYNGEISIRWPNELIIAQAQQI